MFLLVDFLSFLAWVKISIETCYGLEASLEVIIRQKGIFRTGLKYIFMKNMYFKELKKHCFVSMMTRRAPKLNLMLSKSDTQNSAMSNIADFTSSSFHSVKMQFWSQLS